MRRRAALVIVLVVSLCSASCSTLAPFFTDEALADVAVCLATAAQAGADVLALIASVQGDGVKALDIVRIIQAGTKTSSILMVIPSCARIYANRMTMMAEMPANKALQAPYHGILVIPDVKR